MKKAKLLFLIAVVASFMFANQAISADVVKPGNYPAKPVEIIVPYAAGGGMDTSVRILSKHAEKYLGQRIVVSNKPGGGNIQGKVEAINAKPDGYVIGSMGSELATDELIIKGLPYKRNDLQPLCIFGEDPHVITIGKKLADEQNIKTFADFISYVKKNPGKTTFGAGGNWTTHDFLRLMIEEMAGVKFNRMPFLGGAPALQAAGSGNCDVVTPYLPEVMSMLDSGLIVPLAVAYPTRVAQLPNVPTTAEAGYNGMVQSIWRVLFLPKATPAPIVAYLESVFGKTLSDAEYIADARKAGVNPAFRNSKETSKFAEDQYKYFYEKTGLWGIRVN